MNTRLTFILIAMLINSAISSSQTIEQLDKEKQKIKIEIKQKSDKVDKLNEELEEITQNIITTTKALTQKIEDVIKKQEELLKIQNDIISTEKILTSIESSISNMNFNINKKEQEIKKQERNIIEKENLLSEIKKGLDNRTKKAYNFGISNNISKENKKYLVDYYHFIEQEDLKLSSKYRKEKNKLKDDKKILEDSKTSLQNEKKIMEKKHNQNNTLIKELKDKKILEESTLANLKNEKKTLKEKKTSIEKEKNNTENQIDAMNSLISTLVADKKRNEKIKRDLMKKRQQQKQIISKNFQDMKGKLQWPVHGKIISKFGKEINEELNTTTENLGIEIECAQQASATSIMDGIISKITFIPGMGNVIIINHGNDYKTIYSNIEGTIIENKDGIKTIYSNIDNSIYLSENQYINNNFKIGTIGKDPTSNNGKLHFQIWYKDQNLNPESWLIRK